MYRVSSFLTRFAQSLLLGAALATLWATLAPRSYSDFVELRLADRAPVGYPNPDAAFPFDRTLTLGYLCGEALMALFFLYLGKELWEAVALRGGALRGRRALLPLLAALGAAVVPAALYLALSPLAAFPALPAPGAGWPVVVAGDVTLSYVIARALLGRDHPALRLLLLAAIADDIVALLLTGAAFPAAPLRPAWLLLPLTAALATWALFAWAPAALDRGKPLTPATRRARRAGLWPFALAGLLSWWGTQEAGIMPALGLLPLVPAIPHADRAYGVFAAAEEVMADPLNRLGRALARPVTLVLFLFALTHAGANLAGTGTLPLVVAAALLIGKPAGFLAGGWLAARLGQPLPEGMAPRDLATVGAAAAAGLSVPAFAALAALPGGTLQDGARAGLLLTLVLAPFAARLAARRGPR